MKLFGITPSGLNASSQEEIRVFYDEIASFQEAHIRPVLETIFKVVQLHEFGEIDEHLGFEFAPLWQMSEAEQVNITKEKAGIDALNIEQGIISPEEARARQNKERMGIYNELDLSAPLEHDAEHEQDDDDNDAPVEQPRSHAQDSEFKEDDHPRDEDGKFTSGGSGGSGMSNFEQLVKELQAQLAQKDKETEEANRKTEEANRKTEEANRKTEEEYFKGLQEKYKDIIDEYHEKDKLKNLIDTNKVYNMPETGDDPRYKIDNNGDIIKDKDGNPVKREPIIPTILGERVHPQTKKTMPIGVIEGFQEKASRPDKKGRGSGLHHIIYRHGKEIRELGYDNPIQLLRYITKYSTHDYIDERGVRILGIQPAGVENLSDEEKEKVKINMEVLDDDGKMYLVKTAYPSEYDSWRGKVVRRKQKISGGDAAIQGTQPIRIRNVYDLVPEGEITEEERAEHEAAIQKIEDEMRARGEEPVYDENPWAWMIEDNKKK